MPSADWSSDHPTPSSIVRYATLVHFIAASGFLISAAAAVFVYSSPGLYAALFNETGLTSAGWIVTVMPLAIVLLFAPAVPRLSVGAAWAVFVGFSAAIGLSLSSIFAAYAAASVDIMFLASACAYTVLAIVGWRARCDLSAMAKFMIATLFGLIVAAFANLFLRSNPADFVLACLGVLIFAALAAADTQRIRRLYETSPHGSPERMAIFGALTLYLDFLNLFLSPLRIGGKRRRG